MGTDFIARNPDQDLPTGGQWEHPRMSWRLYAAFIDLIQGLGGDTAGITFANNGEITEEQAKDWARRLRPVIPGARRYVRGPICWFEIPGQDAGEDHPVAAIGTSIIVRGALHEQVAEQRGTRSAAEVEMEDPEQTRQWLTFVADYLEHSGGISEW